MPSPELLLLRGASLHAPEPLGRRDLLCGGGRILAIGESLPSLPPELEREEIDLQGATVVPGFVDAHVHVTGGGGEAGRASRVPPLRVQELSAAGVTTVVGLLGTDGTTRSVRELVARTYGLREEGLSAYCWTGNYEVPVKTLTGSIRDDMVFVDPIIGVGELAISDHRSSQPTLDELLRIAADVHVAGMMTGKAGVLHLHLGDGPRGLEPVRLALAGSELPGRVFHPTHVNRRVELWAEALELARHDDPARAPCIDVTAFPAADIGEGLSAAAAIAAWMRAGLPPQRLTCSSDGGGCMPHFDAEGRITSFGVGQASTLLDTLREAVLERELPLSTVLPVLTSNVAALLRLPSKGRLQVGADADLLVLGPDLQLRSVVAGGRFHLRDGEIVQRGPFG